MAPKGSKKDKDKNETKGSKNKNANATVKRRNSSGQVELPLQLSPSLQSKHRKLDEQKKNPSSEGKRTTFTDSEVIIRKVPQEEITEAEEKQIKGNPALMNIFKEMVKEVLTTTTTKDVEPSTSENDKKGKEPEDHIELVKSPSDMTIYAPVLAGRNSHRMGIQENNEFVKSKTNAKFIDDISDFIEGIRVTIKNKEDERHDRHLTPENMKYRSKSERNTAEESDKKFKEAQEKVTKYIMDAEQFRALINEQPKGRSLSSLHDNGLSDDEFFHITCLVYSSLRGKIESGDFVKLEKLLPKSKYKSAEGKIELVNRNGSTYFVPSESGANRISGVRRREQAFRVYTAIYSAANPHRAAEIWQYIHIINTAAASYILENVSSYDYTFRQLMALTLGEAGQKSTHKVGIYA